MKCEICQKESTDKYCDNCKNIRIIYTIHKLLEKFSLNEKINKNILITKKIKNIETYDLELLYENDLLKKDKFKNYQWTSEQKITQYLKSNDKSNKPYKIKKSKTTKKLPEITEIIAVLEKNFNLNEIFNKNNLSDVLNLSNSDTITIINKLNKEHLLKNIRKDNYVLNYHQLIKYKSKHKIHENKINRLNNIKQHIKKESKQIIKNDNSSNENKIKSKKKISKKEEVNIVNLQKESEIIPLLRKFINEDLIILPKNVNKTDISQKQLYNEFININNFNLSFEQFGKIFHRVINTYPHIRHKNIDSQIFYNISLRNKPQLVLDIIQSNNKKFKRNNSSEVELKGNLLEINFNIDNSQLHQLYNLIVYTYDNIIEHSIKKENNLIKVFILYDLSDEDSELWLNFLKSYNLS